MAGEFSHQDASLAGEQIEYGAAAFFVEHVLGLLAESSRSAAGATRSLFSDFFLYRLLSFVHWQKKWSLRAR